MPFWAVLCRIGSSYMVEKNRKLHNQFDTDASSSSHSGLSSDKPIFRGISIFVDGFTIPSSQVCFLPTHFVDSLWFLRIDNKNTKIKDLYNSHFIM